MTAELYWLPHKWPGRLAIAPRPRGGDWLEDETAGWKQAGVGVVVSLLMPDEVDHFELQGEERLCSSHGIEVVSVPIADRGVPASTERITSVAIELADKLRAGKNVVIHCRQGIGRSALVAACIMIALGVGADSAMQQISSARGCPVPETAEQRRWILGFDPRAAVYDLQGKPMPIAGDGQVRGEMLG